MFLKVLFFATTAILVSCSPPPPKITPSKETETLASESLSSSEEFRNMDSSREYFRYTITNCTGGTQEQSDYYNERKKERFLDIEIEDGEVRISRPDKLASLNVGLKGKWDHINSRLTDLSGHFGIGTSEDWSQAEGSLHISDEDITGNIYGAQIEFVGFNTALNDNVNVACSVSLSIEKKRD